MSPSTCTPRLPATSTRWMALLLCLALPAAGAPQDSLPDMGSSAARIITPAEQRDYGAITLAQLRRMDMTLEDPLLSHWLQGVGGRVAGASTLAGEPFRFFLLRDRQINAFATLGGYVGVNAGLVLSATREDELAAVLAHEVSHVTQQHVLRAVERAQRDQVPILLAMLGAIAVAQTAGGGGDSASNATMAAVMGAQGLAVQRQLDYSRSNESEADRVGIRLLARAGYDPEAMAGFFERMQASSRANRGGERERTPDYLLTHPVTTTRIAEAKARASQAAPSRGFTGTVQGPANPLLPQGMQPAARTRSGADAQFAFARERLRALSVAPTTALREYDQIAKARPLDAQQRYGQVVARMAAGQWQAAAEVILPMAAAEPANLWLGLAAAEAENGMGRTAAADARLKALNARLPHNRPVALTWAQMLEQRPGRDGGTQALALLRPLADEAGDDPVFQTRFARAAEVAGEPVRAGEAHAQAAWLNGNPRRALLQLETLRRRNDLDYYARARIEARIAAMTPEVLDMRKQGLQDLDAEPGGPP